MLVVGGGGYTVRNVARCWTFETAVLLGLEISNDLPYNDFYEYYSPDFKLHLTATNAENMNKRQDLENITAQIIKNLKNIQGAPSVQMSTIPSDSVLKNQENLQDAEDKNYDKRLPRMTKDGALKRDEEIEFTSSRNNKKKNQDENNISSSNNNNNGGKDSDDNNEKDELLLSTINSKFTSNRKSILISTTATSNNDNNNIDKNFNNNIKKKLYLNSPLRNNNNTEFKKTSDETSRTEENVPQVVPASCETSNVPTFTSTTFSEDFNNQDKYNNDEDDGGFEEEMDLS
jgi:histone deacetylase 1/2